MHIEINQPTRWTPLVRQITALQGPHDPYDAPPPFTAPRGMRVTGATGSYRFTCALMRNTPLELGWFAQVLDDEYDAGAPEGGLHARILYPAGTANLQLLCTIRAVREALPTSATALAIAYDHWADGTVLELLIDLTCRSDADAVRRALCSQRFAKAA